MAEIVLGLGSSHGPMLVTRAEDWGARVPADRANRHPWRGSVWSFDELVREREAEQLGLQITPDVWADRRQRCQDAIETLADAFWQARPDVAVIIGNDQMELFDDRLMPAFSVFCGADIINAEFSEARMASLPVGVGISIPGYIPSGGAEYDGHPELAAKIVGQAMDDGFDVAVMKSSPKPETPHAFGFVYRQIMRDRPIPSVPVLINTFYPPNQPSASRCLALGRSILKAVQDWKSDARVALIASGGLTHFIIDERVDQILLQAVREGDMDPVAALGEGTFQDGTSEIKNWLPLTSAMIEARFRPSIIDYVPCYRSEAGSGHAMGFVIWRP